jgi:hypothetical protein
MSVWRCLINNSSLVDDLRGLDFFLIHLDDSKTYPLLAGYSNYVTMPFFTRLLLMAETIYLI